MVPLRAPAAFSLVELLTVLVLLGLLLGLAAPSLSAYLQRQRVRTVLDRLVVELYYARALAVRQQAPVRVRFNPRAGCAESYSIGIRDGAVARTVAVGGGDGGVCLSSNVAGDLTINGRGMLIGSPRTIRARSGNAEDSLRVSIVGRLLRFSNRRPR